MASSAEFFLDIPRSVLSRLNLTGVKSSCNGNATGCCRNSRSGMTSEPLTESPGGDSLTSCAAAFPARTYPAPEKGRESAESEAVCGWKWPGSFAKLSPDMSSWKIRQCSLFEDLEPSSVTWPRWGMMQDGECLGLSMPAHLIGDCESGLLPTLVANEGRNRHLPDGKRGMGLENAIKIWPTPQAENFRSRGGKRKGEMGLDRAVKLWPTPHGFSPDGKSNGPSGNELGRAVNLSMYPTPKGSPSGPDFARMDREGLGGDDLATAVAIFPTPTVTDFRTGYGETEAGNKRKENPRGAPLRDEVAPGGQLNPPWVEWLMGWPPGWTDLQPLGTDKFRQWLDSHGRL